MQLNCKNRSSLLVAAAVICALASVPLLTKSATAADLGGDCCADLEERVAELEATTVRKGNKKVSVTLYGQVNRAAYSGTTAPRRMPTSSTITTNPRALASRAVPRRGLATGSAGYRLEVEPTEANSAKLNQFDDNNANDSAGPLNVRHSYLYLNSKNYGEGRMGLTATPIYNITKDTNVTELEDTMHSDNRMMQGFFLRSKGYDSAEALSKLKWQNISSCYDSNNTFVCGTRKNGVAYWSPDVAGFSASVGDFEDDEWGAALRYKKEWGETFDVGAGIGYSKNTDERYLTGGGGVATPTGRTRPSLPRTILRTSSATSRIGLGRLPSSTSRAACSLSVLSVSRRPVTRTASIPDFIPARALPR